MSLRKSLPSIVLTALALSGVPFARDAAAQAPGQANPSDQAKNALEAARDLREKAKGERKKAKEVRETALDARDEAHTARREALEAGKDAREAGREAREAGRTLRKDQLEKLGVRMQELGKNRAERREKYRSVVERRWGSMVVAAPVRAELIRHAWRVARLNRMRDLAEIMGKPEVVVRVDKLIERENARHEKRMAALKANPETPPPGSAAAPGAVSAPPAGAAPTPPAAPAPATSGGAQ